MSSSGAFGPWAANASRAAAIRRSMLRRASARRARTAVANGGRSLVGVVSIGVLAKRRLSPYSTAITGGDLRIGPNPITFANAGRAPTGLQPSRLQRSPDLMFSASPSLPAARDDRWLALAVLCAGMLMIVLDATIVNVALPAIQRDLGFGQSSLAWVVNAYLIAFGGVLLLAGRLGDLVGRRRIFLLGLTVFTLASFACGVSVSGETLIVARFVQGIGGAMTSAVILGLVVTLFPEPRERTRAISLYSFVASAGASIGLLAGGVLTEALNWHWIFFVNLPIGVVTAILSLRLIEDDEGIGLGEGADALGAILVTGALMLGVL